MKIAPIVKLHGPFMPFIFMMAAVAISAIKLNKKV